MSVQHDPQNSRFFIPTEHGDVHLDYIDRGNKTVEFTHVFAPPESRGSGQAGRVVVAAFEWAAQTHARVIPTCPYIAETFLPRFPKYQPLVD